MLVQSLQTRQGPASHRGEVARGSHASRFAGNSANNRSSWVGWVVRACQIKAAHVLHCGHSRGPGFVPLFSERRVSLSMCGVCVQAARNSGFSPGFSGGCFVICVSDLPLLGSELCRRCLRVPLALSYSSALRAASPALCHQFLFRAPARNSLRWCLGSFYMVHMICTRRYHNSHALV
jgi:hypothetical protein